MDKKAAIAALSALGQETRLDVFRHLVTAGPEGVGAGDLAQELDVRANTLSTHLAALARAGLISAERAGRAIRYRADHDGIRALFDFLLHDCCKGRPELCGPFAPSRSPEITKAER
ncbi:helix-turn-helix transcriptional regulator [Stappia sp. ES.058]|uniref:ArsR/SmtB family transcription factor n=1 Tax=Stappia sp. ES.058 TaxID=1881061 RepID=UPI00087B6951|nr:metalloregulator ArsR/SmtB family transcription factor [Stappia sp. ES.058]SDU34226.1 transcriptional regulator, ArsR family [Stappia sp. ES.058]